MQWWLRCISRSDCDYSLLCQTDATLPLSEAIGNNLECPLYSSRKKPARDRLCVFYQRLMKNSQFCDACDDRIPVWHQEGSSRMPIAKRMANDAGAARGLGGGIVHGHPRRDFDRRRAGTVFNVPFPPQSASSRASRSRPCLSLIIADICCRPSSHTVVRNNRTLRSN